MTFQSEIPPNRADQLSDSTSVPWIPNTTFPHSSIGLGAVLILLALVLSFRGRDIIQGAIDLDGGVRKPLPLVLGHPELDNGE